jgi:hypothetical protein
LDCEGAFYYILLDDERILDNIKKVIVENDYCSKEHQNYVEETLIAKGFQLVFSGPHPFADYQDDFYQVFIKA